MTMIPALERELAAAAARSLPAARPVSQRSRRSRRPWSPGVPVLVASLALAGGAFAARGLWLPELGSDSYGHALATGSGVPADQLALLAVLRRPQTDADRGPEVRTVLRQLDAEYGEIRTGAVRRLGTLPTGEIAVLVPARLPRGFDPTLPNLTRDQLLLGFYDPESNEVAAPSVPVDELGLRAGNSMVKLGPDTTPRQRRLTDQWLEREHRAGRLERYPGEPARYGLLSVEQSERLRAAVGIHDSDPAWWVGLVPDGVRQVEVDGRPPVAVRDNFFAAPSTVGAVERVTWLDEDGARVPFASTAGAWTTPSP